MKKLIILIAVLFSTSAFAGVGTGGTGGFNSTEEIDGVGTGGTGAF